jgi:hypothetical protein
MSSCRKHPPPYDAVTGMVNVDFFPCHDTLLQPLMWWLRFHPTIITHLIISDNPTREITNTTIELVGTVTHHNTTA